MDIADLILSHKCPGDPLVTKPGLGLHLQMGEVNKVLAEYRQSLPLSSCVQVSNLALSLWAISLPEMVASEAQLLC